jgi:release factor glutamine methyltransferase
MSSAGTDEAWTVRRLLQWTTSRFADLGLESPRVDAELLLAHALGCTRLTLYVDHDKLVHPDERTRFRELVRRRLAREPVAYIEGRRGFHALDLLLRVDRRVLVPRPETEGLVDWVLAELRPAPAPAQVVLDVGTGSGAIAIAIAHARHDVEVLASDVSPEALEVAADNVATSGRPVALVRADLLEGVAVPPGGFTAIVANLPYIAHGELASLAPEVRDHEPTLALDGGPDGLDLVRRLTVQAPSRLAAHGGLYLEIGSDQGPAVEELLRAAGLVDVEVRKDLGGHTRWARAFRG